MCRYRIAVLLLACVFIHQNPSLALRRPSRRQSRRPSSFSSEIWGTGNGKDGKFWDIKKEIIDKSEPLKNNLATLHLAHVFPWAAIDECIREYTKSGYPGYQTNLTAIVEKIFEIDKQAVVPKSWTKKTNSETRDFIPDSKEIVLHDEYLGSNLESVNEQLLADALDVCKVGLGGPNAHNCKVLLHNAPANLRFGLDSHNRAISDRLDLMGDTNGKKTTKEEDLITIMEDCYTTIGEWCGRRNPYCVSDKQGKFGIRSSSSYHTFVY